MPSVILTQPAEEPISLTDAKLHLRVDIADDDALITSLIIAARQAAENICRRLFVTQTVKMVLDQFPAPGMNIGSANWYGPQWGNTPGPLTVLRADGRTGYEIFLPASPVQSITSITYIDQDGNQQTLPPSSYKLDNVSEPSRIVPSYGTTWPTTRNEINAVEVTFAAGYGPATAVPDGIKSWLKIRIATLYENREGVAVIIKGKVEALPYVDGLLDPYRVVTF